MRLGLASPFSQGANFSGFFSEGTPPPHHLSRIVQEVDIQVDEAGTQAAAATAAYLTRSLQKSLSSTDPSSS